MTAWQSVAVVVGLLVLGLAALASVHARRDRRRRETTAPRPWALPIIREALARRRDFDESFAAVERLMAGTGTTRPGDAVAEVAARVRRELAEPGYCAFCDGPCRWFAGHPGGDEVRARFLKPPPDLEVRMRELAARGLVAALDRDLLGLGVGPGERLPNCRCVYPETHSPSDSERNVRRMLGYPLAAGLGDDERTRWLLGVGLNEVDELARLYELDDVEVEP